MALAIGRTAGQELRRLVGTEPVEQLRRMLEQLAAAQPVPGTLAHWVDELLAPRWRRATVAEKRTRVLVGLAPLPGGAKDNARPGARTVRQVAGAFGVGAALVHSSLQVMRRQWQEAACREQLEEVLRDSIESLGPVCLLEEAARELARRRAAGEEPDTEQQALAGVLVRVAAELRPAAIHWRRLDNGDAWVALKPSQLDALAGLGVAADSLAAEDSPAFHDSNIGSRP